MCGAWFRWARPKSVTLAMPSQVSRTLLVLTSRCTIQLRCAWARLQDLGQRELAILGCQQLYLGVQGSARQVLQNQKRLSIGFRDIVDGCDVRVIQSGEGPGLRQEPFARLGRFEEVRRQEFERHQPVQFKVAGLVDPGHASLAQLGENLVVKDGAARDGVGLRTALSRHQLAPCEAHKHPWNRGNGPV